MTISPGSAARLAREARLQAWISRGEPFSSAVLDDLIRELRTRHHLAEGNDIVDLLYACGYDYLNDELIRYTHDRRMLHD